MRGIINKMGIMSIIIKIVMMMTWSYKVVSYDHNNCDNTALNCDNTAPNCDNTAPRTATSPAIISHHQVVTIRNKIYKNKTIIKTIIKDNPHYYTNKTNTQSSTIILYNNPTNNRLSPTHPLIATRAAAVYSHTTSTTRHHPVTVKSKGNPISNILNNKNTHIR